MSAALAGSPEVSSSLEPDREERSSRHAGGGGTGCERWGGVQCPDMKPARAGNQASFMARDASGTAEEAFLMARWACLVAAQAALTARQAELTAKWASLAAEEAD